MDIREGQGAGDGNGRAGATSPYSNSYFFTYTTFIQPTTLYFADETGVKEVKRLPVMWDSSGMKVDQFEATSKDGTKIPFFVVSREGLRNDGANPTLLYAYGGFEVSNTPAYATTLGAAWLERGGIYVLANIRGGGEFGPQWHRAGLKENRQRIYDDFIAVAEELITRKITSPRHLGIMGGSNGGLLVGVALTQRPELFNAVVVQVPLLDMQRYSTLLAGASWMAEYGDPDKPEEWAFISKYSPYQNRQAERSIRRCCSPRRHGTTGSIQDMRARWPRKWNRWGTRSTTSRTPRAGTVGRDQRAAGAHDCHHLRLRLAAVGEVTLKDVESPRCLVPCRSAAISRGGCLPKKHESAQKRHEIHDCRSDERALLLP